ncbi:hypothetical protein IJ182_07800 [bacterium]|nr:hypothetical protein [bacterium]
MSVSISAVPIFLLFSVSSGVIEYIKMANEAKHNTLSESNGQIHVDDNFLEDLYNREFSTQILDKNILLKTLEEHGATNIQENNDNITCDCEAFHLDFTKSEGVPYTLKITTNDKYNLDEFVNDIGKEYTLNAQEVSYNQIKKRLEEQQLEIEDEEIYDDNTIVLTVNLE